MDDSRRRSLQRLAVSTGLLWVVGCVERSKGGAPPLAADPDDPGDEVDDALPPDAGPLITQFRMEDAAVFAYDAAAPAMRDADLKRTLIQFREHHQRHQDEAVKALEALGVALPTLPETYALPDLGDDPDAAVVKYALTLETQAVAAYLGVISDLADAGFRRTAASILVSESAHVVWLRQRFGLPDAFDVGLATDLSVPS